MAMKQHEYLLLCLPLKQRKLLKAKFVVNFFRFLFFASVLFPWYLPGTCNLGLSFRHRNGITECNSMLSKEHWKLGGTALLWSSMVVEEYDYIKNMCGKDCENSFPTETGPHGRFIILFSFEEEKCFDSSVQGKFLHKFFKMY